MMNTWVTLNVGGQKFFTNYNIFMREPESMLAKMFNGNMKPGEKDADGAILIDRSPDYFKTIINYFRTGQVIIDPNTSAEGVLQEAKYYNIETLITKLHYYQSDADMSAAKLKNMDETLDMISSTLIRIEKCITSVTGGVYPASPKPDKAILIRKA